MAGLEVKQRRVYWAPTARRHYFTKRAAANAEARAQIVSKYPSEHEEYDERGYMTSPGYYWRNDERLLDVHSRLADWIFRRLPADGGADG